MHPKHIRSLAILILVSVVGIYILNLFIDNPYTHRIVRSQINQAVKEHSEIQMDYKSLKVSLLPPGVDLYNLQIKHPEVPDQSLLSLGQIRLRLSLLGLLFGELRFGLIEFFDADFSYPLPIAMEKIFQSKNPESPPEQKEESSFSWPPNFDLPLDTLRIRNLKTFVKIPEDDDSLEKPEEDLLILALQGFNLEFNFYSWSESQIIVDANSVSLDLPSDGIQPLVDSKVYWKANLNKRGLASKEFKIENRWYKLIGNLGAEFFQNPEQKKILDRIQLRGDLSVDGDFEAIGSLLKIEDTSGKMSGSSIVTVDIPIHEEGKTKFAVNAKAKLKSAKLFGFGLLDSEAELRINKTGIEFQRINILDGDSSYGEAKGELFFKKPLDYNFSLNAQSLPLVKLLTALKVDLNALDTSLSSEEIMIKGTGKPFRLKTEGVVQLENFRSPIFEKRAKRFKTGPNFRFPLNLEVDEDKMIIPRVNGYAFYMENPSRNLLHEKPVKTPEGSSMQSPMSLGGIFHFDENKGMKLDLESESFQFGLSRYFSQFSMNGSTKLKASISGPYADIRAKTDILSADMGIGFLKFSLLEVQGEFYPDSFRWNTLKIRTPQKEDGVFENGKVFFDEHMRVELKGSIQNFNPDTLINLQDTFLFNEERKSHFKTRIERADFELAGPLLKPLAMQGKINCKMQDGFLDKEALWSELNFNATHSSDDYWNFSQIDYVNRSLKITSSLQQQARAEKNHGRSSQAYVLQNLWETMESLGWSDHAVKGEFKVSTVETKTIREPNALSGVPFLNKIFSDFLLEGSLKGDGKFSGSKENLQLLSNISLSNLELFGSKLSPISNKIFLQDNKLEWISTQGGSAFQSRLNLNLESTLIPYTWNIEAKRWDVRFLAPTKMFHSDPRNYAYLSSSVDLRGNFSDFIGSTKGRIGIDDFRFRFQRNLDMQNRVLDLTLKKPVVFTSEDSFWTIENSDKLELTGEKISLRVSTSPRNSLSKQIDLRVDGFFALDVLRDFTQIIESANGRIVFDGRILGNIPNIQPNFNFRTETNDLKQEVSQSNKELSEDLGTSIGVTDLRPAFRKINLEAQLTGRELIIRRFAALKGNGSVSANGRINLGDSQKPDTLLTVKTENAGIVYPIAVFKSFDTNVNSLLTITGRNFPYTLSGDIEIVKARSYREFDIRDEIVEALRRRSVAIDPLQRDAFLKLDLRIKADESIAVSNKNFQTVASTNLVIQGSDIQPDIRGQIEINRGKFEYKRSFNIEQGIISFDDPVKPDPRLNITGFSEVSGYRVTVSISGRASNPKIELGIDPPTKEGGNIINEIDILVLLSTGQLPASDRQFGDSQAAATAEALNIVAGQLEKPVEELFELSGQKVVRQVYIDTSEVEGRAVPRFNVPVNVGENVSVVFRVVNQSNWKISSEYAVHESISLSGSLDGKRPEENNNSTISKAPADTSVDLKFRFAFP